MKTLCNGNYAKTLRLSDRYFFCENCRLCDLSSQLPDWDADAEWNDIVEKMNSLYPYKIKIWFGKSNRPTVRQYSTTKEMVEDVCSVSYVAGLNDYEVRVQVFE